MQGINGAVISLNLNLSLIYAVRVLFLVSSYTTITCQSIITVKQAYRRYTRFNKSIPALSSTKNQFAHLVRRELRSQRAHLKKKF